MAENTTHAILVVDTSASMTHIRTGAEKGINSFIEEQSASEDGKLAVTLIEFDSDVKTTYSQVPVSKVKDYTLRPGGTTALLDAVGIAVNKATAVGELYDSTLIVIVTDGQENSSRRYTVGQVQSLLSEFQANEANGVIFQAADLETASYAENLGVARSNTAVFETTPDSLLNSYAAASTYVSSRRAGNTAATLDDSK